MADFASPITWALIIGWIMSVVLHEFAHGLVGYLGGDYTIRERGGLTLNPLQYIDPVNSILLPIVFLIMGGIPLPGGVTYIRRDLLRSRAWDSGVALAGPVMNIILFLLLVMPFHPRVGWIDTTLEPGQFTTWQIFLGAMAQLQIIAVVINLIPCPPLDGFNVIAPFLDPQTRVKLSTPPVSTFAFLALFMIIWNSPAMNWIYELKDHVLTWMGFDWESINVIRRTFNIGLFGHTD